MARRPASTTADGGGWVDRKPKKESTTLRVFISFHGNGFGGKFAKKLARYIKRDFPFASVFVSNEQDSKNMGEDWKFQVATALHTANVFIVVIDSQFHALVHKPGSEVRQEVEAALWNPNISIHFPFRLNGVEIPPDLPVSIARLVKGECGQDGGKQGDWINQQTETLIRQLRTKERELLHENTMPIALVSSALALHRTNDTLAYFSLVVTEIVQRARAERSVPMDVVVKIPEMRDVTAVDLQQKAILEEVLGDWRRYRAIIINPFRAEALESMIREFRLAHPVYPLFTVDQCFGPKPWYGQMRKERVPGIEKKTRLTTRDGVLPPGVMCDWYTGGKLAGKLLLAYLNLVGVRKPLIWVLTGNPGTEDRQKGFHKQINGDIHVEELKGAFQADRAKEEFLCKWKRERCLPHAVFCTNDEMALGVCAALEDIRSSVALESPASSDPTFGIKIIGFDAIHDFTTHISEKAHRREVSGYYLNTIDVKVRAQADRLIHMVVEYLRSQGQKPEPRIALVEPRAFLSLDIQNARVSAELEVWKKKRNQDLEEYRKARCSRRSTTSSPRRETL